jgi:hypothetical protein
MKLDAQAPAPAESTPAESTPAIPAVVVNGAAVEAPAAAEKPTEKPAETPSETPTDKPAETPAADEVPKLDAEAPKTNPVTLKSAAEEAAKNEGKLSEATLKALEAKGLTAEDVEVYAAGAAAKANAGKAALATALTTVAGDAATLKAVIAHANSTADAETRSAFNAAIDRGDAATAKALVKAFHTAYVAEHGQEPAARVDGEARPHGVQPFASQEEMAKAIKDKRYGKDAAYTTQVQKRIHIS